MNKYISSFVFFFAGVACLHADDSANADLKTLLSGYVADRDSDGNSDSDFTISFTIVGVDPSNLAFPAPIVKFGNVRANNEIKKEGSEVVEKIEQYIPVAFYYGNETLGLDDYSPGDSYDPSPGIGQSLFDGYRDLSSWPEEAIWFREGWFWMPEDGIANHTYTLSYNATADMLTLSISDTSTRKEVGTLLFKEVLFFDASSIEFQANITVSNLSVVVPAIPEPSAFGLLAGLGALALVASRRRRK